MRSLPRLLHGLVVAVAAVVLLAPVVIVILSSLGGGVFLQFPPESLTLDAYRTFFDDPSWVAALRNSAELATAVAVGSTLAGTVLAIGSARAKTRVVRGALEFFGIAPLVLPVIVLATANYDLQPKLHLYGVASVVIAQSVLAMPYAYLFVQAGLARTDPALWPAALTLGDTRLGAAVRIHVPLLAPNIAMSAGFGAVISLTEPLMPLFLGSNEYSTLAQRTLEGLQHGIDQRDAVAAALMLGAALILALGTVALAAGRRYAATSSAAR